jgi:hypothetical protein
MKAKKKNICMHEHHNILPILVILFATSFLLKEQGLLAAESVNIFWPILVGIGGIVMLIEDKCECC